MRVLALFVGFLLLIGSPVLAQEVTPGFSLQGVGMPAKAVTSNDVAVLPAIEQDISFKTSKGQESGHYKGALLWTLLDASGLLDKAGHHGELRQTFEVTGSDGYRIVFSVGEIAPDFGNRAIMIATEIDGKPLGPEGMRLVVPGDARGARSVKGIASIAVH